MEKNIVALQEAFETFKMLAEVICDLQQEERAAQTATARKVEEPTTKGEKVTKVRPMLRRVLVMGLYAILFIIMLCSLAVVLAIC